MAGERQIEYQEHCHTYRWRADGRVLPSVTRIIKRVVQPFKDFKKPANLEYLANLGRAVHKAVELDAFFDLDEGSVAEVIEPYITAWRLARKDLGIRPKAVEQIVGSREMGFAGRFDMEAYIEELGSECLIDLKTTRKVWDHLRLQLALYVMGRVEDHPMNGFASKRRVILQLLPSGGYNLETFDDHEDEQAALSLLDEYHAMEGGWK